MLEAMGAQLILGAQQILMVLGAQGARGAQTMNCTIAEYVSSDIKNDPAIIKQALLIFAAIHVNAPNISAILKRHFLNFEKPQRILKRLSTPKIHN